MNKVIQNIIRFCLLLLLQVLILNNIQLSSYVNPFLYILFILMLPFDAPRWLVLLLSFFMGLAMDMFSDTLGMHTTASVFLGYIRYYILRLIAPRDGYEITMEPTYHQMGSYWFAIYCIIGVLSHHAVLFFIEVFNFHDFFFTLLRIIVSSFFTIIFVYIYQALFHSAKQ